MAEPLIIIDMLLALAALIAVSFAGRNAGRLHRDPASARRLRRALIVTAGLLTLRLAGAVLLATGGPELLGLELTLGLPLAVATTGWALLDRRRSVPATHAAVAGGLVAFWLRLVPPGPQDTMTTVAVAVLLVAAAIAGSVLLTRWRSGGSRRARAPWFGAGALAALAVLGLVGWLGAGGRPASASSGTDHAAHTGGPVDLGGGPAGGHHAGHRAVQDLTGPRDRKPDVSVTLTAAHATVRLSSGRTVDGLTFNGRAPGPEIRVRQGQLLEVVLVNRDVTEGVTVHWHGVDVPNAEDGVAGLTQEAVPPGASHRYRFVPDRAGTFWYHTHHAADQTVRRGLFGALIVAPPAEGFERTFFTHLWPGDDQPTPAFGTADAVQQHRLAAGERAYLRFVNSSPEPQRLTTHGTALTVAAIDGNAVDGATELAAGTDVLLPAGGRADLTFSMPDAAVTIRIDAGENPNDAALVLSPAGSAQPAAPGRGTPVDPLTYGARPASPPPIATGGYDREFTVALQDGFAWHDGGLTYGTLMNGRMAPSVPTLMVTEGDRVRVRIVNRGIMDHPMHLHGHRVLVLSRNGTPSTGGPWWTDTLNVGPGQSFEVVFTADNPGIWMDHCHNLEHAAAGMVMHLAYTGVHA
ncbi:multicopper oxidase family protein [Actinoplanes auranticolor]|uniref:FtsP/CotA-like multicopper oxidase with cupredoxin domain n=1 Tax=Actinoplanes auranticolor TaxID=47988 RepID=A0A919SAA7_9ACTN|nr:multicopper oxidase family protein [Actinoplanes auranticolor]GIM66719.1 hypothetical protein Aau02nite_24140 [Actinoplanes auranticolor]